MFTIFILTLTILHHHIRNVNESSKRTFAPFLHFNGIGKLISHFSNYGIVLISKLIFMLYSGRQNQDNNQILFLRTFQMIS